MRRCRYTRALQAAIREQKDTETLRLMRDILHEYGVDAYHHNQAHIWWGWHL